MYNFIIHISLVYLYLRWVFGLPLSMTMVRPPLLPQRLPNSSLRKSSVLILQNLSTWQEVTRKLPGSKKRDQKGQSVRIFFGVPQMYFWVGYLQHVMVLTKIFDSQNQWSTWSVHVHKSSWQLTFWWVDVLHWMTTFLSMTPKGTARHPAFYRSDAHGAAFQRDKALSHNKVANGVTWLFG